MDEPGGRPRQRTKTSSGDMSQSCPYYPGQVLCRPTSTQVIQGSNCLSIGPKDNNKRMTIEHAECSIQSTISVLWPCLPVKLSFTLHRYSKAIRLSGSRWRQPGQTGSVALFERGEHQVRLVRVKQEESRTRLAKTQLDPYQIEIKLTLCGLGWV